jgi:hypothetical protein
LLSFVFNFSNSQQITTKPMLSYVSLIHQSLTLSLPPFYSSSTMEQPSYTSGALHPA